MEFESIKFIFNGYKKQILIILKHNSMLIGDIQLVISKHIQRFTSKEFLYSLEKFRLVHFSAHNCFLAPFRCIQLIFLGELIADNSLEFIG